MNCDVGEPTEELENELWCRWSDGKFGEWAELRHSSLSNPSVALPTSQLILQPFFLFSYVTGSSLNVTSRAAHALVACAISLIPRLRNYRYRYRFWHLSLIIWPSWSKKRKHNYQKKASPRNAICSITLMNYVIKEYTNLSYMSRWARVPPAS